MKVKVVADKAVSKLFNRQQSLFKKFKYKIILDGYPAGERDCIGNVLNDNYFFISKGWDFF